MFDGENYSNGDGLKQLEKFNSKEVLLSSLKTSEETGIASDDSHQMSERISAYGTNAARPIKIKSLCDLLIEQLDDTTLKILIVSSIVSLSIGIWEDVHAYYTHTKIVI